jgi:hypothetical protein
MTDEDLNKLEAEIEADYKASMAVIKAVRLHREKRQARSKQLASVSESYQPVRRPSQIIEQIIKSTEGHFDVGLLRFKYRQETGKKPSDHISLLISQMIKRMRDTNEVEVVTEGKGRRSGTYQFVKK